jgi:hypothetical protein
MQKPWREEIATHLELAAQALKMCKDVLFERHVKLAIGYLEQAARAGESPTAVRLLEEFGRGLVEREHTEQMKFTPDEMERLEREAQERDAQVPPPSLPAGLPSRKLG